MIRLQDLCDDLKETLSVPLFQDACPNGLQVSGKGQIKTFATAVSASLDVIYQASLKKVDLLIVHHGLFWNRDSFVIQGTKREKIALLLKHNISLLAYHLPLDAHPILGNNWKAAKDMGWHHLEPFGLFNGMAIGVKGRFLKKPVEAFQRELEDYYNHPAHVALGGKTQVATAALISGGAHREIVSAANEGVDCFITGSFDEPTWNQAKEEKIHFFALGHAATERIGPKALGCYVEKKYGIIHYHINSDNPF